MDNIYAFKTIGIFRAPKPFMKANNYIITRRDLYHEKRSAIEGFIFTVYANRQGPKVNWHLASISSG